MEFKSLKNIESSLRQMRLFGIVFLSLCAVVAIWSAWSSYHFMERQHEKIYMLGNSKSPMLAPSQDLSQSRPAEAGEHVRRFHGLFLTLSLEKSVIEHNMKRVLLLADKSVYNYYSGFTEKGYYNRVVADSINQVLKVDSVVCDFNGYPYRAVTYTTQKIIQQNDVTGHSLVIACRLLNSFRSDDNPNRLTIEGFTVIEDKNLQTIKRQTDMKKIKKPFQGAYQKLHGEGKMLVARLRGYLDGLPPETHRRIVLAMPAVSATLALYAFGKAVYNIDRNDGNRMVVDHAGQMELSVQQKMENHLIPYLYGTDKERSED